MNELVNKLLSELADEIDITESQEGVIKHAYNSVAEWLNQKDTIISKHEAQIFPQGSMMYGTTIKPINEEDDYDIDLVCEFTALTDSLTPSYVKKSVGKRLMEHSAYKNMLQKEGRRCWTLQYGGNLNFHMDILPAIPFTKEHEINDSFRSSYESMSAWKDKAMLATDKDKQTSSYDFTPTNPKGYAEWFKKKTQVGKTIMLNDSIERVPQYPRKTILQKSIQLLKRHRDVMFADGDEEVKPISMIITTLVAKCYNGETQIYDFICKALNTLDKHIETGPGGKYIIKNPVMSSENFADKWQENPAKAKAFFMWKNKAINDFKRLSNLTSYTDFAKAFKEMFAQKPVDRLMNKYLHKLQQEREDGGTTSDKLRTLTILEKIPYRKSPPWNLPKGYCIAIKGEVSFDNKNTFKCFTSGTLLPKGADLRFTPLHGIKLPYKIKWQITNTGAEAQRANCLRGEEFEDGNISYQGILYSKEERTAYTGTHYVQCFVIKNGNQCVGVSEPFVVKIE